MACFITKEHGGKVYAVVLTGTFMLFSGFMIFGSIFTYDSAGNLITVAALFAAVKAVRENPRWWIAAGVLTGIGILNKLTVVFFVPAIALSLLILPQRAVFRRRWIWIAGCTAIPFALPFLMWQSNNGWYFLDFASAYTGETAYRASFPVFLWNQILHNNIKLFPVWLAGLIVLLVSPRWRTHRFLGMCYLILFLVFYLLHSPFYFLLPLYAVLIPAGSIWIEERLGHFPPTSRIARILRTGIPAAYVAGSLPLLPLAAPVLPVEQLVRYASALGVDAGIRTNNITEGILPQHFADRFGWEEMVSAIARVYHASAAGEHGEPGIITGNYGEASAVHRYRSAYGLPEPISTHGWFYFEAMRTHSFRSSYVAFGVSTEMLHEGFSTVQEKDIFRNPYCIPYENNQRIYFCSGLKCDLERRWRVEKRMDTQFRKCIDTAGVIRAIECYHALKAKDPATLLFTERQINTLGYVYLNKGDVDAAIALFALNVEVFPDSYSTYDSLGEGYLKKGEYRLAAQFYEESLRRNPANANAREHLRKLHTSP